MVSRLDFRSIQRVLNQELEMEDERIPQQMQKKSTMVEKDVNLSCVFLLMLMNPIFNGNFEWWRFTTLGKAMDFKFQSSLQNNKAFWSQTPLVVVCISPFKDLHSKRKF